MVAYILWVVLLLSIGLTSSKKRDIASLREQGRKDTATVVTVSIMIWHTQEFEESFNDTSGKKMDEFIKKMLDDANKGFENSKIPVRVAKHAVKIHPKLSENKEKKAQWKNGKTLELVDFQYSMFKNELLNCADAATFLVIDWGKENSGGGAPTGTADSCHTFSIIKKKTIERWYTTFGHELGHNFGANHDVAHDKQNVSGDTHGHQIQPPGKPGYFTIMAYNGPGHDTPANYYSNPDVIFPETKTPTGIPGVSNVARVITQNRFLMASCGNEEPSGRCIDCKLHPDIDLCITCCERVQLRGNTAENYGGTYNIYKATPTSYNRKVYKHETKDYCLYYSGGEKGFWIFNECNQIDKMSQQYHIGSNVTENKCVHSEKLKWYIGKKFQPSMEVSCID